MSFYPKKTILMKLPSIIEEKYGHVIKTIGIEKYNEVIKIKNLNDFGNLVLERIIYFYNQSLEYQERTEKVIADYWDEYNAEN